MSPAHGDRVRVAELLGREPRGPFEVVVRDGSGDPVVLRNAPFLDDGTPMPTRYWLVGPDEIRRIGRLEADGGVTAAENAVPADRIADAHRRYADERDADIPTDHPGPRPTGGVGGTRVGVKCLHAHWAWHLAGGDDPVGRWIASRLGDDTRPTTPSVTVTVDDRVTVVGLADGSTVEIPWGPVSLTHRWLHETDPPRPEGLTNALGAMTDHLDDLVRERPALLDLDVLAFAGPAIGSLARVEVGSTTVDAVLDIDRDTVEEIFRIVATDRAVDRAAHPGLPAEHVDTIVATCCVVLSFLRRLRPGTARLLTGGD